jgi:hypothetical protein
VEVQGTNPPEISPKDNTILANQISLLKRLILWNRVIFSISILYHIFFSKYKYPQWCCATVKKGAHKEEKTMYPS